MLFAGGVSIPQRFDGAYLTLSADAAAQAAQVLGARAVVPVHFEGWGHFTQGAAELREAFAEAGHRRPPHRARAGRERQRVIRRTPSHPIG